MSGMRYCYCSHCTYGFPMSESVYDGYERSGETFYCPQGHRLAITQDSVVGRLRASERSLEQTRDTVSVLCKRIESAKGVITRQRNRLIRGVCPYCNKSRLEIDEHNLLYHIKMRHGQGK